VRATAPVVSREVDDVVEVETNDNFIARVQQKHAAVVDGHDDVTAGQHRTLHAVGLKHRREVGRPDSRRTGDQLVTDLCHDTLLLEIFH